MQKILLDLPSLRRLSEAVQKTESKKDIEPIIISDYTEQTYVKITNTGSATYTGIEVIFNKSTGLWENMPAGRQWGGSYLPELIEINNVTSVTVNTIVIAFIKGVKNSYSRWFFDSSSGSGVSRDDIHFDYTTSGNNIIVSGGYLNQVYDISSSTSDGDESSSSSSYDNSSSSTDIWLKCGAKRIWVNGDTFTKSGPKYIYLLFKVNVNTGTICVADTVQESNTLPDYIDSYDSSDDIYRYVKLVLHEIDAHDNVLSWYHGDYNSLFYSITEKLKSLATYDDTQLQRLDHDISGNIIWKACDCFDEGTSSSESTDGNDSSSSSEEIYAKCCGNINPEQGYPHLIVRVSWSYNCPAYPPVAESSSSESEESGLSSSSSEFQCKRRNVIYFLGCAWKNGEEKEVCPSAYSTAFSAESWKNIQNAGGPTSGFGNYRNLILNQGLNNAAMQCRFPADISDPNYDFNLYKFKATYIGTTTITSTVTQYINSHSQTAANFNFGNTFLTSNVLTGSFTTIPNPDTGEIVTVTYTYKPNDGWKGGL